MKPARFALLALLPLFPPPAGAQTQPTAVARGAIERVSPDGATLVTRTRDGREQTIRLGDASTVTLVLSATLADVKPGAFIGVAAVPGDGGALKAMEVHIFPESMRGTGEGHRPFDLAPGSTMTNGAVAARVDGVGGASVTVTYNGGQQVIAVDPGAPIVSFAPGARADLKPGAAVVARGPREGDGTIDAMRILVGKDGLVPPL
ncbi:hypothetical protein DFR50_103185 [Roseiarcus fermentans]|uniref:DUF5666 domain-containing protein n=1 Tax=Roseiarcus fermentans TaxID=1473586 RepID=A0A366FRQ8_9HYPH|nr:hypothetical protein [Roseiarcus fermentans]RBP17298.1 hypothetical protein DFR50_103185 [Roseiarcus fermentans]